MLALADAQIGAHFEQKIMRWNNIARGQRREHVGGQPPGAGSELDDVARRTNQYIGDLRRQRTAEQRRQLRRGDEIAILAEFACARNVVTETRGVERGAHVIRNGDPSARLDDRRRNMRDDFFAVRTGVGRRQRQFARIGAGWRAWHRCVRLPSKCSRSAACRAKSY